MGNSFGCSASGERLVSAARDGDFVEAKMLLDCNPCLSKYSTFGGLNSPLHFAAAKGHNEIVALLLENGADVNSRNYCGQTALMQACRYGHWEVVQTLLLFRCNVSFHFNIKNGKIHFVPELFTLSHLGLRTIKHNKMTPQIKSRQAIKLKSTDHLVTCDSEVPKCDKVDSLEVIRADYLSGRTALHFAAVNGHVRCMRLVVADFVPSAPFESLNAQTISDRSDGSNAKPKFEQSVLSKFVNKAADGGITALHMAALNGYFDCVQLLLDLHANVSAVTFHYGTSMDLIGAGSTPLHYAACGGNLKCCQILLARGASRLSLNCCGWLPLDVARMWGRHWLEPLLSPNCNMPVPIFPPSNYLSLPLLSVLNIARDCGSRFLATASDDADICAVCLERACFVAAEGCAHELCVRCALYLCSSSNITSESSIRPGSIPCPLCRHGIVYFVKLPGSSSKEMHSPLSLGLSTHCMLHPREHDTSETVGSPDTRKNHVASISSDIFCPVTCSPFPSVAIPMCTCSEGPSPDFDPRESENQEEQSMRRSKPGTRGREKTKGVRLEKTTCSNMFRGRRSCSTEHKCNA